ncbi:MAG: bifunctional phosphoribosylaminoimidazolecarboxamide formyltransferase/IMP cyclohydrolase [Pegethrix bostrychoides GSE-TBD4-15B]|jgi:phosphoribosylaminoimidazolecarboxamide formyltransferase/IMP cyclohydrolase|uniref:Bifunctional purine biosynthesis protein PurH n=1 Tax=Pegethrix bostrychoides GSE-TBD4-15B TaxID=2839662 RepID=A0A951PBA5_9CYAN|nr:bifunctional phosphoribosylaminoimidazolecarboxamide formyltransferase/IMP cyclohydrolase [Pegethrix bostrychoides GSE-TBD4-15B]
MARLALLSVSNKTGLIELARSLVEEFEFEIVSSGGTAAALKQAGIPVVKVSDYTGSPEILGGRVKTLHPRIHGGILARPDQASDLADLEAQQIRPFDLVVVNLYPFEQTIAQGADLAEAIEQIDIGGPAMLRASAKNFAHLCVLCQPEQYPAYLQELRTDQSASLQFRQSAALRAFEHTAAYDSAISAYLRRLEPAGEPVGEPELPVSFSLSGQQIQVLRYGENPHQAAAWYQTGAVSTGWGAATQLQGKELSYNNLVDLEAARQIVAEFASPAAVIIKHTNPCGVALGSNLHEAYTKAFAADAVSAFGGIVALNRPLDEATAAELTKTFLECVVVPACDPAAAAVLAAKSKLRLLLLPDLLSGSQQLVKQIAGGFLLQTADDQPVEPTDWQVVSQRQPTAAQRAELEFAWKVCKHVKSNAIVISQSQTTCGIGAGQMNRVGSVKIALEQAAAKAEGAILASDGFFPFDDSVRTAAAAGIAAIVQPGGSLRDPDSIKAADELELVMLLTGRRHFLH